VNNQHNGVVLLFFADGAVNIIVKVGVAVRPIYTESCTMEHGPYLWAGF